MGQTKLRTTQMSGSMSDLVYSGSRTSAARGDQLTAANVPHLGAVLGQFAGAIGRITGKTGVGADGFVNGTAGTFYADLKSDSAGNIDIGSTTDADKFGDIYVGDAKGLQIGIAEEHKIIDGNPGLLIDSSEIIDINSSGGAISIGNDADAQGINIGTGAAARTIAIGNETGATALDLDAGTGGVAIDAQGAGAIGIGTQADTGVINVGTGASARVVTVGNVTGATSVALNAGTGGIALASTGTGDITINSDDTLLLDSDGVLELNAAAGGTISIGNDAVAQDFNLGSGAATGTIQVGNAARTAVDVDALAVTVTSVNALSVTDGAANLAYDGSGAVTLTSVAYDHNASGAITIDSTSGGISLGANSASDFTLTNGDLSLKTTRTGATAGRVVISGSAASGGGDAVLVQSSMHILGGLTVDGVTTSVDTTNLQVTDKNILINREGNTAGTVGAGLDIEGDSAAVVGYIKVDASDNDKFALKAPGDASVLTIDTNANSLVTFAGDLNVELASAINQDLTTNSTVVQFAGLNMSDGNITNVGSVAADSIIVDDAAVGLDVIFGGNTTLNKMSLTDNLADALNITEGVNSYLKFNTANTGGELMEVSKPFSFVGADGAREIQIMDNKAVGVGGGLNIAEGANSYLLLDTTNGSERIQLSKFTQILDSQALRLGSAAGATGDLQLIHDTANSSIKNYTGHLTVASTVTGKSLFLSASHAGAVEIQSGRNIFFADSNMSGSVTDVRGLMMSQGGGASGKVEVQQYINNFGQASIIKAINSAFYASGSGGDPSRTVKTLSSDVAANAVVFGVGNGFSTAGLGTPAALDKAVSVFVNGQLLLTGSSNDYVFLNSPGADTDVKMTFGLQISDVVQVIVKP